MAEKRQEIDYPLPRVGRLNSLAGVRLELTRVYRDARQGKIPTQEASRLTFILSVIARVIEGSELERRVEALERMAGGQNG